MVHSCDFGVLLFSFKLPLVASFLILKFKRRQQGLICKQTKRIIKWRLIGIKCIPRKSTVFGFPGNFSRIFFLVLATICSPLISLHHKEMFGLNESDHCLMLAETDFTSRSFLFVGPSPYQIGH